MAHKLCSICNKHSIIERVCAIDYADNEIWTEWYCRTCKRVIEDHELYPEHFSEWNRYQEKISSEKVVAKQLKDEWIVNWYNTKILVKDPTVYVVGDYRVTNSKGIDSLIKKEQFEKDFELIKEVQDK
ncbi:MAG: hypothetical protein ACTSPO_15875 [Candidatus Heimdallarchaeaceae archaeon]